MGRYTDAKCKQCRLEGNKLFLKGDRCYTDKCAFALATSCSAFVITAKLFIKTPSLTILLFHYHNEEILI